MSDLTDVLSMSLLRDLEGHLSAYQISNLWDGNELWPDATPREAAAWYLANSLFKKYNDKPRPSVKAQELALSKFLACNTANAAFDVRCDYLHDEELVNGVSDELYNFWYVGDGKTTPLCSTFNQIYERGKLGKGSNRSARSTDLYTKVFDSSLSHTSESLAFVWRKLASQDPRFSNAEQVRSDRFGFKQVEGNSLSFVNKNVDVARGICTEPTINMWFQLGFGAILTERLKSRYDISLDVQPDINRVMARTGSITGRFATIDLESASDLISVNLSRRILPRGMFDWLMRFRSPTTKLPSGEVIELHSISTMGNGFTFPLMTAIFCAVISVVYRRLGIPLQKGNSGERNFSVFGDDLIVVSEAVPLLYRVLGLLGFRVNYTKSFVEGPFRESCGADFYNGQAVRGVYIKRLQTVQDFVVAVNALNRWSASTGIYVPRLVGELLRLARQRKAVLYGPPDEADDACVHVPLDMARGVKRMRFGLIQYKRWLPKPRYLLVNTSTETITVVGEERSGRAPVKRNWNPHGLWLSHLFGVIREGKWSGDGQNAHFTARLSVQADDTITYLAKPRVSASWDALVPGPEQLVHSFGWPQWSAAVRWNLDPSGCVG